MLVGYFDGDIFAVEAAFIGVMDLLGHEPVKRCRHFGGDPVGADPQGGEGIVGRGLRQGRGRVEENQSQCQRLGRFFAGERGGKHGVTLDFGRRKSIARSGDAGKRSLEPQGPAAIFLR